MRGDEVTRFSCVIKNRSFYKARTVTALTVVKVPGWFKRRFTRWKKKPQQAIFIPFGLPPPTTLGSRDEETIQAELRKGDTPGVYELGADFRLLAHAGSKTSPPKSLKKGQ